MTDSLLIDAVGSIVRIDLSSLDEGDSAAVRAAWSDALAGKGASATRTVTPEPLRSRAAMLMSLSQAVTMAALESARGEMWLLHAAGLAFADGRVVIAVGPSGRGKTTLARTLGRELGYVSDESIGIAFDGSVVPYRKPLSIIERPGEPKVERAPSELGLRPLPAAELRLATIVLLDRRVDGPTEPVVRRVDFTDAVADLALQSSGLADMAAPLRTIARHAEATGGVVRVTYREADALGAVIASLVEGQRAGTPTRYSDPVMLPVPVRDLTETWYERTPYRDAIALDDPDRVLLMSRVLGPPTVLMLAGIAPAIWRAASEVGFDALVDAVVDAHGVPDGLDARAVVASSLADLVAAGLIFERDGEP